jgi:hypothetical protein
MPGVEPYGFVIVFDGLLVLASVVIDVAPVVIGVGRPRVKLNGPFVLVDLPLGLAQGVIDVAPVVIGVGRPRIKPDILAILSDGRW